MANFFNEDENEPGSLLQCTSRSLVSQFDAGFQAPELSQQKTELDLLDETTEKSLSGYPTEGKDSQLYVGELMHNPQLEIFARRLLTPPPDAPYVFVRVPVFVNDLYLKQTHWKTQGDEVIGIVEKRDVRPWPATLLKDLETRARKEQNNHSPDAPVIFWLPLRCEFQVHYCTLAWESCEPQIVYASDSQERYWDEIPSLNDIGQVRRSLYAIMEFYDTDVEDKAAVSIHRAVRRIWSDLDAETAPKVKEFKGHRMPFDESCGWCCLSDGKHLAQTGSIGDIPIATLNKVRQTIPLSEVYMPEKLLKQRKGGALRTQSVKLKIKEVPQINPDPTDSKNESKKDKSSTTTRSSTGALKTYVPSGNVRQKVLLPEDCDPLPAGLRCLTKGSSGVLLSEVDDCFDNMPDVDPDRVTLTKILLKKKIEEVAKIMRSL